MPAPWFAAGIPPSSKWSNTTPISTVTDKEIKTGLEVTVVGKTEDAIKVAKNHAQIISGFVRTGEVNKEHPKALR